MYFPHQALKDRLDEIQPLYDAVNKCAQDLISEGLGSDPAFVKQMTKNDKAWNDVNDATANQIKDLEATLDQLEKIQDSLKDADEAIGAFEEKVKNQPPIATDAEAIEKQMEDLKVCVCITIT